MKRFSLKNEKNSLLLASPTKRPLSAVGAQNVQILLVLGQKAPYKKNFYIFF